MNLSSKIRLFALKKINRTNTSVVFIANLH